MRTAQPGDRVKVHYVIRAQDGTGVSTRARGRAPLELTVGRDHPRLPGLGLALAGLGPGAHAVLTVPAEWAFGPHDPARICRRPRRWFPGEARLEEGKLVRMTDGRGRRRLVRVIKTVSDMVVVDANHRWAGQVLEMDVELVCILTADPEPTPPSH